MVVFYSRFGALPPDRDLNKSAFLVSLELQKGDLNKHGGSEPKHRVQAEPTVPVTARQGAAAAEGEPGRGAGHVPVLGLRAGGVWDEQCAGARGQRVPARVRETQASTAEEEGVRVL